MSMDTRLIREAKRAYGKKPHQLTPEELHLCRAKCRLDIEGAQHQRREREREYQQLVKDAHGSIITPAQIGRGAVGLVKAAVGPKTLRVPQEVFDERWGKCERCDFAKRHEKGKLAGKLKRCSICRCGFKNKLKLKKEQCAKGDPRYPKYQHLPPEWGQYIEPTIGAT